MSKCLGCGVKHVFFPLLIAGSYINYLVQSKFVRLVEVAGAFGQVVVRKVQPVLLAIKCCHAHIGCGLLVGNRGG